MMTTSIKSMFKDIFSIVEKLKANTFILQSIKTLALRIFGIIVLFGFTLYLTNHYNPKIIGQYDFIRTFLLVVGSICLVGTEQSILYFSGVLKSKDSISSLKEIYKKMVFIIFIISVVFFVFVFQINEQIISNFFHDKLIYPIIIRSTAILFFYSLTLLNTEVFRALESVYIAEIFRNTLKYISVIIGSVILLHLNQQEFLVDTFLFGFVLLALISTFMVIRLFRVEIAPKKLDLDTFSYSMILNKSYPMAISAMAIFLLMTFDIVFLKKYRGDQTVAFYNVAIKIMTIISMVINIINVTIASKIAEYFSSNDSEKLTNTLKNASRLIFILTFPLSLLVCFYPDFILGFFGQDYLVAKEPLIILVIGQGVCSFFGTAPVYLNMTGRQNAFQIILIIAVFINFILNRFLIPIYGMTGAAIAFSASMFFWNFTVALLVYIKDKKAIFLN